MSSVTVDPKCEHYEVWREVNTRYYIYKPDEPKGVPVSLEELLLPGIYRAHEGVYYRVKNSPLGKHGFITHTVFVRGGKTQRTYVLFFSGENINLGISLLVADNERTNVNKIRCNQRQVDGERDLNNLEEKLNEWSTKVICETWHPSANSYDTGYPAGPPLELIIPKDMVGRAPATVPCPDRELYEEFKVSMKHFEQSPRLMTSARCGKTRKIGMCRVQDTITTIKYRTAGKSTNTFIRAKNKLTLGPVGVTIMPKIGTITSTGKPRIVFPMSPTLQIGLEHAIGKRILHLPGVSSVVGNNFPRYKHTYDVKSCDVALWPYLHRYIREEQPELASLFMPDVHVGEEHFQANQFLSGLFGTNHVVECFTSAIARIAHRDHCGYECDRHTMYIQGDGIMSPFAIEHPLIRPCEPYCINGFSYEHGTGKESQYINATLRLTTPRLARRRKLNGPEGWAFRREIYIRFLNPRDCPPNHTSFDFSKASAKELLDIAYKNNICQRKLRYVEADEEFDAHTFVQGSNWDYANTVAEPVTIPDTDVLDLPPFGPHSPFDQRHDTLLADASYSRKW